MIIWIASYPRSGNTFFRILLNRLYRFQTHSVYAGEAWAKLPGDTQSMGDLTGQTEAECNIGSLLADSATHFVKTHDLPGADNCGAVVLIRDGRDAVTSYAHFALKTEKGIDRPSREEYEKSLEEIIRGEHFGGWSRNVTAWADRVGHDRVIHFEDLIRNPSETVAKALRRFSLNGSAANAAPPSFEELHTAMPWFFRRGTPGGWEEEMPLRLQELFWDLHGDTMQRFGYSRRPLLREPLRATDFR